MNEGITIGLDLAKNVFQMHGVSDAGAVMISKRLSIWQHSASGVGKAMFDNPEVAKFNEPIPIWRNGPTRVGVLTDKMF